MSTYLIHVRCSDTGIWSVRPDDVQVPLSEHTTETEAERVALQRASEREDASVMIRDRYSRVRIVRPRAADRAVRRRRR
jgi:hypothetical protein